MPVAGFFDYMSLYYFDPAGNAWRINSDTLALRPAVAAMSRVWTSTDCSGPTYLVPSYGGEALPPPGATFAVYDTSLIRTRHGTAQAITISVCSVAEATGACQAAQPCPEARTAIRETETSVVTIPAVSGTPPIRPVFAP